jgi:hypothetical protein
MRSLFEVFLRCSLATLLFFQKYDFEILCPTGLNLKESVEDKGKQKIFMRKNKWCLSLLDGAEVLTLFEGVSPENPTSEGTKNASKTLLPNRLVGRTE